ncbi:hypothetical protein HBH43_035410 [Parastagonospora nodorum]|nr:hypothetical protein HBI09_014460 [Parastagonospora nodorum]KAH4177718.1 hypothetical protein HBH43_035410 [Parastagonospora nodorum]KAH5022200.1 hypothetical protein HBI77_032510 [Parastagonospora nodorum]KAH6022100.1 hypothetical protein HBI83_095140 [Parastagonospora nodorum]
MQEPALNMSSLLEKPVSIELPVKQPRVQREYTTSPPDAHLHTPRAFHGFIPLSTPVYLPDLAGSNAQKMHLDYFSVPKKESVVSPAPVQYESNVFVPLCSVAAVEQGMDAADYFSQSSTQINQETTQKAFVAVSNDQIPRTPAPVPRLQFSGHTIRISIQDLKHPTGSPVHERDITSSYTGLYSPSDFNVNSQGGDSCSDKLNGIAKGQESGQSKEAMEATLNTLEERNRIFEKCVLNLEHAALGLDAVQSQLERTKSTSSFRSAKSSVCSEQTVKEPTDDEPTRETAWQSLAETISLPDSESIDEEEDEDDGDGFLKINVFDVDGGRRSLAPCMDTIPEVEYPVRKSSLLPYSSLLSPPHRHRRKLGPLRTSTPSDPSIYKTATSTSTKVLASLLVGPKINIVNGSSGEVYVSGVPERMLVYFCGQEAVSRLLPGYNTPQEVLEVPASEAEKKGIVRVMRFMRRCCSPRSHASSGDIQIPQGNDYLRDGIDTVRACRVFDLRVDADRMERLVVQNLVLSDDAIDQVWNGHFGCMRDTSFGDAVVWFILTETQKDRIGMGEELMCMLEYEEFKELKERVREEVKIRKWRCEARDEYLDRYHRDRNRKQKIRLRLQNQESDRMAKLVEVRTQNKEASPGIKNMAGSIHSFSTEKGLPTLPSDPHLSAENDDAASTSPSQNVANSIRSMDMNKELPTPPSETESASSTEATASDMYATFVRSLGNAPRSVQSNRPMRRDPTTSTGLRLILGDMSDDAWEAPRAAPVPRIKSSLWMRLKHAFDE